jgi:signal transduction histidine kinase
MTNTERSQLSLILSSRCRAIADTWYQALTAATSETPADARQHISEMTQQIVQLLQAETLDRHEAQAVGTHLTQLGYTSPFTLSATQAALGASLIEDLPAEHAIILYPTLISLLAELAAGFLQQTPPFATHSSTKLQQLEAALQNALAQKEEENLAALKRRFTVLVSHEFRTPLAIMLTANDLLKSYGERLSDARKQELLETTQRQIKHLDRLLDDILLISKAETPAHEFTPYPLDLTAFCHDLVDGVQRDHPSHPIDFQFSGDCRQAMVDATLLRQIITGLLANAANHAPQNTVIVFTVACTDDSAIFRLQDQGVRAFRDYDPQLYEAFFAGHDLNLFSGIDLELALIRYKIELHRGTFTFESTQSGTTFIVQLPLESNPA